MNEELLKIYEEIFDNYKKAELVSYGTPDQYQFRQNELSKSVAKFILMPYWKWQVENESKVDERIEEK